MSEEQAAPVPPAPAPVVAAPDPNAKRPRDYQVSALKAMAESFVNRADTQRGLVVLPTGSGKTFVATRFNKAVIAKLGCVVVWVAHRDELIKQARAEHAKVAPEVKVTEWTQDAKDASGQVILVMIGSSKGLVAALESQHGVNSGKIVLAIDEAHHFAEKEGRYTNLYAELEEGLKASGLCRFSYGLTATSERLDGRKLGYERIVYQMSFIEGVQKGALARPMYYEMRTHQEFHLDEVVKEDGKKDYTDADLRQLDNDDRNTKIAREWLRHREWFVDAQGNILVDKAGNKRRGWGKTLLFSIDVSHAFHMAEKLKELEPTVDVRVITGKTKDDEREEFQKWFADGDCYTPKVAINCQVYTEGFDEKTINSVFLTRPTKSEALWMQMVGRGARIIRDAEDKIVKGVFNLVSIMDEIGRYGTLVKEWTLNITDEEEFEKKKLRAAQKQRVVAKRRLVELVEEKVSLTKSLDMDDATLIDVQAILIVASKVNVPSGIPLDRDRIDCIRLLKDYVAKCFKTDPSGRMTFEIDAFKDSYSHCVPANEFDHKTWRELMWAYYFHFIRKESEVWNNVTRKKEKTWRIVPMVPMEELEGIEARKATGDRLKHVQENTEKKNAEFNLTHGSSDGQKALMKLVFEEMRQRGMWRELKFVRSYMVSARCCDRRLEIKTNYMVQGNRDTALKYIGSLNTTGTQILQEALQDSVAEFRVSPARNR